MGVDPRRFEFQRDSFAFANELVWEYRFTPDSRRPRITRRDPPPAYAHRCFVLARAARQFHYHSRFEPARPAASETGYRGLIRQVLSRNPRLPCGREDQVLFPGYPGLRAFSAAHEASLKAECGGAWRSYLLRSHWRMIFPISRGHQQRTAWALEKGLRLGRAPIVHLVRFPRLSINHGMVLFDAAGSAVGIDFHAYDPNDPEQPTTLTFDRPSRTFTLPSNRYWPGGRVDVIEIYCGWLL
jgi:hypothetical protein